MKAPQPPDEELRQFMAELKHAKEELNCKGGVP
jgi:hypothetical protein